MKNKNISEIEFNTSFRNHNLRNAKRRALTLLKKKYYSEWLKIVHRLYNEVKI